MPKDISSLFCNLVKIPSPSGKELEVARFISNYLRKSGIYHYTDRVGKTIGSNSGNLIAELKGEGPTIMFIAHIDTVETGNTPIKPVISDGTITSDGNTILGVDNKAAVAALMEALAEIKRKKTRPNIIAVFSVREEDGEMGVKYLKPRTMPDQVFVIDGSSPLGTFISCALGDTLFEIRLHGRSVHVAYAEKGINAMKAAGIIMASQRLGKLDDGSYVNISKVVSEGKNNVIPGEVLLSGEVRAFNKSKIVRRIKELKSKARDACRITGCTYDLLINRKESIQPFNSIAKEGIASIARMASKQAGLKFGMVRVKGTMETNVMQGRYRYMIGISRGGKMPHSKSESITVKELESLKGLIVAIADSVQKMRVSKRVP